MTTIHRELIKALEAVFAKC